MSQGQPGSSRPRTGASDASARVPLEAQFCESTVLWAGATALLGDEGRLAYSDLMIRAQNIASTLRREGLRPGDLAGVIGVRSFATVAGVLGILLAGGVYVPFDVHGISNDRLARQLDDSAIRLLLTDRSQEMGNALPWARRVTILDTAAVEREFMPMFSEVKLVRRLAEDPAAVLYNAEGRGVLLTHAGITRLVSSGALLEFSPADTMLLHAGIQQHTFQMELWGPLLAGGTVALAPESWRGSSISAYEYARVLRRHRVTLLCAKPALLQELAQETSLPLEQVRQAVVDASELEVPLLSLMGGSALRVVGGLGAAETTSFAVTLQMNVEEATGAEATPGSEALVVLPDGREASPGALGTLAVGGDALAIGYLGEPEATLEAFPQAERANGQRMRTFRLPVLAARLADGRLITGKAAEAAASAASQPPGSTQEVEALLQAHPLVRECVAMPAEGRVRCAFVTLKQEHDPRAERALREYLQSSLPPARQPDMLVLLAEMPLDANSRPDRQQLGKRCDSLLERYFPAAPPQPSQEGQEEIVRGIWQRLLHRMQVDPDEDFYAGGGTAVQRIRLYAELNQRFPGAFTMGELRSLNTIRKVVAHLRSRPSREGQREAERRGA